MVDHLSLMKHTAANMHVAGKPISLKQLVSFIVSELEAECLPITCQVNCKSDWKWQEFHANTLAFESQLKQLHIIPKTTDISAPSANMATSSMGRVIIEAGHMKTTKTQIVIEEAEVNDEEDVQITTNRPAKYAESIAIQQPTVIIASTKSTWAQIRNSES